MKRVPITVINTKGNIFFWITTILLELHTIRIHTVFVL